MLRSENSEENSEESRLFTGENLVLRPALRRWQDHFFELKIERSFRRTFLGEEFSGEALLAYNLFQVIGCREDS